MDKPAGCASCEYRNVGEGFCPDHIVEGARLCTCASSPSSGEVAADEPSPLIGPSGFLLDAWVLPRAGLSGVPMSKMNVLHCNPPDNVYPRGKIRYAAELACKQYHKLSPADFDTTLVTIHPSNILGGKYDLLPFIVRDYQRAKALLDSGLTVFVCAGLESMELFAPHLRQSENEWTKTGVKRWRGHYWANGRDVKLPDFSVPAAPPEVDSALDLRLDKPCAVDLEWDREGHITESTVYDGECVWYADWRNDDRAGAWMGTVVNEVPTIIGHNFLGHDSDYDRLRAHDVRFHHGKVHDTMLQFHLLWPQFAGHGHLDLWSMVSLYTDWTNWKSCRGEGMCHGPCPLHQPRAYNIQDTVGAYVAWEAMLPELQIRGLV